MNIGPGFNRATSKVLYNPPVIVFFPQTEVIHNEDGSVEVKAYAIVQHSNAYDCPVGGYAAINEHGPGGKADTEFLYPTYEGDPGSMKVIIRRFTIEPFPVKDADGNQCFSWRRTE